MDFKQEIYIKNLAEKFEEKIIAIQQKSFRAYCFFDREKEEVKSQPKND